MSSKLVPIAPALLLGLLLLSSCTEEMPVDAIYTNDTDWTPSIVLSHNDYQRVEFTIERPSRKELLRNVLWYRIQVRSGTSTSYQNVDSISGGNIVPAVLFTGVIAAVFAGFIYYTSRMVFGQPSPAAQKGDADVMSLLLLGILLAGLLMLGVYLPPPLRQSIEAAVTVLKG